MLRFCQHCKQDALTTVDAVSGVAICSVCGSPVKQEGSLPPGTIVSGFRIESEIGRGGMGVVYKATQMNLERPVALKVLSDELASNSNFVERFFREARSAASLSHPNIVQAYDAGATPDGIYYFAMELIDGETLESRISRKGRLPVKEAVEIATKIADALNYAWERQRLCHGDIKPDNIILGSMGSVKLADLGLAKSLRDNSVDHDLMATPLYAPPEIIKGHREKIGAQSDMYSFGATLYNMLSGSPPFPGDDPNAVFDRHLNEAPTPLSEKVREAGPALSNLVGRLLEKEPGARFQAWSDVVEALELPAGGGEHKKLRMHSISHPATATASALRSAAPGAEEIAPFQKRFPIALILAGVALALVLAVAAVAVVSHRNAQAAKMESERKLAQSLQEWKLFKQSLASMPAEKAAGLLREYLARVKAGAPAEAQSLLASLTAKAQLEKDSEPFRKRLAETLKAVNEPKPASKRSLLELQSLCAQIEKLRKHLAENPAHAEFAPPEVQSLLESSHAEFKAAAAKIAQAEAANSKAAAEKKERDRLEAEQQRRAEEMKKAKEAKAFLAKNQALDDFFLALSSRFPSDSPASGAPKEAAAELAALVAKHKGQIPQRLADDVEALKLASERVVQLLDFFDENEALLKGQPLPGELAPGYTVDSIDGKVIKLVQEEGKVKIGKKIPWAQLKPEHMDALVKERLLAKGAFAALPPKAQDSLLACLLFDGKLELLANALELSSLPKADKQRWGSCLETVQSARKEAEAIALWRSAEEGVARKDYAGAMTVLSEFADSCKGTGCYQRYAEPARALLAKFRSLSPSILAKEMLERAKAATSKNEPSAALALASTAAVRYAFLNSLDQPLKAELLAAREAALSIVRSASQVRNLSDNKIAFYYWEKETPGDAWAYKNIVAAGNVFKPDNPIFALLSSSSELDAGIWDNVAKDLPGLSQASRALAHAAGPVKNWGPGLQFGLVLAADRFQDSVFKQELAKAAAEALPGFEEPMRSLALSMAMEQALLSRDAKSAESLGKSAKVPADPQSQRYAFRAALLHLLALLQSQSLPPETFAETLDAYEKAFGGPKGQFASDLEVCRAVQRLVSGGDAAAPPVEAFASAKLAYPDVCARLLVDACARAYVQERCPEMDFDKFFAALDDRVSGCIVSAELWERLLVFKLARSSSSAEMLEALDLALSETRLCALPAYTRIFILRAALQSSAQGGTAANAASICSSFMKGCPLLSPSEASFEALAKPDSAAKLVTSLISSGEGKEAFWLGAASLLAIPGNASHATAVQKTLSSSPDLTWEERAFLKTMQSR